MLLFKAKWMFVLLQRKPMNYHNMYIRVSKNALFSVKHSMTGGKKKLEWRRVRKYIRFLILFSQRSSDCKKPFSRIFGNFIAQHFLWIYIIFHILTQPKNPLFFFFTIFSGIIHWFPPLKKLRMRTMHFLVLVFEHCSLE